MLASFRGNFAGHRVSDLKLALVTLASTIALRCCVLSIVLGAAGSLSAADEIPEARPTSQRSPLFRLPGFLKRDRETKATTKATPPDPYLARATQLLAQARAFEAKGNPTASLEMARRAESIVKAASQTTGTRWPSGVQSPIQYIGELSKLTRVADQPLASVAYPPTLTDTLPFADDPQSRTQSSLPVTVAPGPTTPRLPKELATQSVPLSPSNSQEQETTNVPVPANRPLQADSGSPVLNGGNRSRTSTIKLTGASQPEQPSSTTDDKTDETSLLFQQLGKLETWSAIEPPDDKNSELQTQDVGKEKFNELSTQSPMAVPALIDRPDEIDDQNVAPISTRPTDSIEGSAPKSVTTTIPVVPESIEQTPPMQLRQNGSRSGDRETIIAAEDDDSQGNIYDATPQLLTQPNDATLAATTRSTDNPTSVWQIAAAQLVATFLGVLLAIGLFLVIRAAAMQLFGTQLGVTFYFGSKSSVSAESKSKIESADTVPFGVKSPHDSTATADLQPEETRQAGDAADSTSTDFPFRVVGSSKSDHDSSAEGDLNQQQETAILRTVFDQNLDLMSELDKQNGSAA